MEKFMEWLPGILFYGKYITLIFVVWLVFLYLIKNREIRGFLTTVSGVLIFLFYGYIQDGYWDKFILIAVIILTGVAIISVFAFELIRALLLFMKNSEK